MPTPWERTDYAVSNLSRGEFLAAAQSLVNPDALSPEEQKSVADRFLGGKPGLLGPILRIATNPLVIVGAVLASKYPLPAVTNVLKYRDSIESLSKTEFIGLKGLKDLYEIFDKKTSALLEHAVTGVHAWNESFIGHINHVLDMYIKKGGQLSEASYYKMAAYLDDLGNPHHRSWTFLRRITPDADLLLPGGKSPVNFTVSDSEKMLAIGVRENMNAQQRQLRNVAGAAGEKELQRIAKERGFEWRGFTEQKNYWPHLESLTREQADRIYNEWASKVGISEGTYNRVISEGAGTQFSNRLLPRHGIMLPKEEHLKAAGMWTPELEKAYGYADQWAAAHDQTIRRYSLHLLETTQNYTHDMARTYAWAIPPSGGTTSTGKQILDQLAKYELQDRQRAAILKDTYIPMARGHLTWSQSLQSAWWAGQRSKWAAGIKGLPVPDDVKQFLLKPLESPVGWGFHSIGHKLTNYFYGTTLSYNIMSPLYNLTQSLNSIAVMGIGNWFKGAQEAGRRGAKIVEDMLGGMDFESAVWRRMPEFAESGLNVGTFAARNELQSAIEAARTEIGPTSSVREAWNKFMKYGMAFFQGTETFNRASCFYGARKWFLKDAVGETWRNVLTDTEHVLRPGTVEMGKAAEEFATLTTRATQYGGGLLGTPQFTAKWWAPLKQYTQFPLRSLGFFAGPATRMGGINGEFNFGTLGRALLASSLTYEAGKELGGIDMSRALMFGMMPQLQEPSERNPLGIIPLAPPIVQAGAGLGAYLATGDTAHLKKQLPLMVPGGVQLSRIAQAVSPGISQALDRSYADYNNRTPDGKIPLMNSEGRLITTLTPLQVWARAAGVPLRAIQQEATLAKYLTSQRDEIRGLRGAYTDALVNNDTSKAESIQAEYKHRFPGMGEIVVKKSDIQAADTRRQVPRLERILKTMPPESRPAFLEAISRSMGVAAAQSLENGTPLITRAPPTINMTRLTPGFGGVAQPASPDESGGGNIGFGSYGGFD